MDSNFPLELRCQVYDITKGPLDSGKEVMVSDTLCATASKDPVKVTHTYKVPSPAKDHRYMYVARYLTSGAPGAIWNARTAKDEIQVLASLVPVY